MIGLRPSPAGDATTSPARTAPSAGATTGASTVDITPAVALERLSDWGFLATPDLPDRPGPASLLVAMRERPTLRHYDPELVTYWVSEAGRGRPRWLSRESPVPLSDAVSWGRIRLTDRLAVTNEYLTFGAHLEAAMLDGVLVACFTSDAPILRSGGHSQGWDEGGEQLGAFFGRMILAVDYVPGFEERLATAQPLARYAAFLADAVERYRASRPLRERTGAWPLLAAAATRLAGDHPDAWRDGVAIQAAMADRAGGAAAISAPAPR
jgi:hypothetical protein